ncbi:site-specific DNA-methyltransferase [Apilactobacillus kunkeei]|uniref:site-specific DNA-methyltransferase n=1 Tax=Apilactobacillus kunkeei TaxID=148814 RepID=UPI0006C707BD|nr:site-specific DNA-methyltransferase [Apilactobacillus kunkeei]KOY70954.1 Uncharacterized protein RZ55_00350 [Apilactobacillus kunkeei]KPN80822.1 Uncharacterized protein RZ76_00350 [Apilactobacillus kunkeei]
MTNRPEKIDLSDIKSRKVDENMLNELRDLFEKADEQKERYDFTWNGKAKAYFEAASPSTKTLKPDEKESVDFKNSENLFITGDNLEALKLMQESYLGKIDMIYIDPPYNTGKDFVYKDDFRKSKQETDLSEGNVDEEGNRLIKNDKNSGRYHSDWLSMMYPRLKLARNLLSDNGVIYVSIDDNEQSNLRMIMDEIFGENNFIGDFIVRSSPNARDYGHIGQQHEYALFYSKNKEDTITNKLPVKDKKFKYNDDDGGFNLIGLYNSNEKFTPENRPNLYYPFYVYTDKKIDNDFFEIGLEKKENSIKIYPPKSVKNNVQFVWRWGKEKSAENLNKDIVAYYDKNGEYKIVQKLRNKERLIRSILYDAKYASATGTTEVEKLFDNKIFDFPKPTPLIKDFLEVGTNKNSLVLDFFAGSGTTAEALFKLNKEDNGNRKFILVTLDEKIDESSLAYKNGYKTIDEISRDRIKRSASKLDDNSGFRALKVENTNLDENVFKKASDLKQGQLIMDIENNSDNRSDYELLYDVLISSAFEYNRPISIDTLDGKKVIKYDYFGVLSGVVAYFGDDLSDDLIRKIADLKPLIAVFKESTFDKSSQKVNLLEQFRITSPDTKVKVI